MRAKVNTATDSYFSENTILYIVEDLELVSPTEASTYQTSTPIHLELRRYSNEPLSFLVFVFSLNDDDEVFAIEEESFEDLTYSDDFFISSAGKYRVEFAWTTPDFLFDQDETWETVFNIDVVENNLRRNSLVGSDSSDAISIYPNPTKSDYSVSYFLKKEEYVTMELLSVNGMRSEIPEIIFEEFQKEGMQYLSFDGKNMTPGVYFLIVKGNNGTFYKQKLIKY